MEVLIKNVSAGPFTFFSDLICFSVNPIPLLCMQHILLGYNLFLIGIILFHKTLTLQERNFIVLFRNNKDCPF